MALIKTSLAMFNYFYYCWWLLPSFKTGVHLRGENLSLPHGLKSSFLCQLLSFFSHSVFCVSEGKCFLLPFPLFLSYTRLCVQFPPTSGYIYVLQKISFLLRSCDSTSDLPRDKDLTCFPSSQRTGYVWSCRAVEAATDFTYSRAFQNSTGHSIESQCPLRSPVVSVLNSYICPHFWICPP